MSTRVNWYEKPSSAPPDTRTSVVTSRVRMARNISGIPFPSRMSLDDYLSLRSRVFNLLSDRQFVECRTGYGFGYQRADFLISDEGNESPSVAYGNPLTGQTVVIGDEDHLRIGSVSSGLNLESAFVQTMQVERQLASTLTFSFDTDRFGFLTASMANAGLAMRASVWMHLPGLNLSGRWSDLEPLLYSMDISMRGILGEESNVTAGLVQLSNRTSYGQSAQDLIAKVMRVIELVDDAERSVMADLLRQHRTATLDYLKWMAMLEQPFLSRDAFVHAVSAALLAARLGYNVRFNSELALRVLIAGFKSLQADQTVQMQVVRNLLKDTVMDS